MQLEPRAQKHVGVYGAGADIESVNRPADLPRHRAIYEQLLSEIQSGAYKPGERLPSEASLCQRFQASRITVAKAIQSLQRDNLVTRRPGSGTYVEKPAQGQSHRFGVLIPEFGTTDIFEPICQGILRSPSARSHSLTWGSSHSTSPNTPAAVEQLCRQYMAEGVSGIFFAPSESSGGCEESNRRVASMCASAGIPVVLLDRDFERYPDRSNFDLVGIDNHRAGYVLTRHLLQTGARRIVFAARTNSAGTVLARYLGYRDALACLAAGCKPIFFLTDFANSDDIKTMLDREEPDALVCANDLTAARIMQVFASIGVRVPADVKMVGVDDVSYAKFLPTPLTTVRQNCAEIGAAAMSTMLDRLNHPTQPIRDVLVRCELVIRSSCGAKLESDESEQVI